MRPNDRNDTGASEGDSESLFSLIPQDKDSDIHTIAAGLDGIDWAYAVLPSAALFFFATDVLGYPFSYKLVGACFAVSTVFFFVARWLPFYSSLRELTRRNIAYLYRRIRMPLIGEQARDIPGIVDVIRKYDALVDKQDGIFGGYEVTLTNTSQQSASDFRSDVRDIAKRFDTKIGKHGDKGFDIKIRIEQDEYRPSELTALREAQTGGDLTDYERKYARAREEYALEDSSDPDDEDEDNGYLTEEGVMERTVQILVPVEPDEGIGLNPLKAKLYEFGIFNPGDAERVSQGRLLNQRMNEVEAFAESIGIGGKRLDTDELIARQRAHWQNDRSLDLNNVTADGPVYATEETQLPGDREIDDGSAAVADGGNVAEAESNAETPASTDGEGEDESESEADSDVESESESDGPSTLGQRAAAMARAHADGDERDRMYNLYAPHEPDEARTHVALPDANEVAQSLYVTGWPNWSQAGLLDTVTKLPGVRYQMAINLHARERYEKRSELKHEKQKIATSAIWSDWFGDGQSADADAAGEDKQDLTDYMRDHRVEATEVTAVITARGSDLDQVRRAVTAIENECHEAGVEVETARCNQLSALQTTAPVGRDVLDEEMAVDLRYDMPSDAVGTLFSYGGNVRQDDNGTIYGYAKDGQGDSAILGPLVIDREKPEAPHRMIIGRTGSGKTAGENIDILEDHIRNPGTKTVIFDIAEGFDGPTYAQGGAKITVGETIINPFEVHPPEDASSAASPVEDKASLIADMVMIHMRKHAQGDVSGLHDPAYEAAMQTFRNHGIIPGRMETLDPDNRDTDGFPTFSDFFETVEDMKHNPDEFVRTSATNQRRNAAEKLVSNLSAFDSANGDARYGFLDGQSQVDLTDDTVLLDMNKFEERGTVERSMLMRLMVGQAYEIAKTTDQRVTVVVDEAHKVFHDEKDAEKFQELVRAGRNYGLAFDFISQAGTDFAEGPAGVIADQCPIKIWHKVGDLDANALEKHYGLDAEYASLVADRLEAGDKEGTDRSEALVFINDDIYLIEKKLSNYERALVEYKESDDGDFAAYMARRTDAHSLPAVDVAAIAGIGPEAASRLYQDDIMTTTDIVAAGADEVAKAADISPQRALDWIKRAYDGKFLDYEDTTPVQETGTDALAEDETATPQQSEAATDGGREGAQEGSDAPATVPTEKSANAVLTDLNRVGPARADDLREAGYESVADVDATDHRSLADDVDGIGECRAKQIKDSAAAIFDDNSQPAVTDGGREREHENDTEETAREENESGERGEQ